jgi:protein-S-isoprenylcysteine O-methyltransferase Ste14
MASEADNSPDPESGLKKRATERLAITLACLAAMLFVAAGSLRFWQAWLFLLLMTGFWIFFLTDFLKRDPQLLERRLQRRETEPAQKLFQKLSSLIMVSGFLLTGLDYRCGWSRAGIGPVPLWLVLAAQAVVVASFWLVFWVMKTNTFAASTIQVERGQKVIQSGPYALVRHPMYLGMALAALSAPLALGSYVSLPYFALYVPLLVYRLIHEERTLRRDLPGYPEYGERTRFRLVPWVW